MLKECWRSTIDGEVCHSQCGDAIAFVIGKNKVDIDSNAYAAMSIFFGQHDRDKP